jgi:hypothetical protein
MPQVFHFTDGSNLPRIFEAGVLRCHRDAPVEVDVGDQSIKGNRQHIEVGCGPGGQVCDYVPFYFATRSPMLFSIKCGNVDGVDPDQRRLVYMVSSTEILYDAGLDCVFSDGNAASYSITEFEEDRQKLSSHVDWDVMELTIWKNTAEDPDRRRRRMAEFLVHEEVPLELFTELGVYNAAVKGRVEEMLGDRAIPVSVRDGWYF